MALRLIPLDGGKAIKLDKPVLLFGRNPDCDVVLTESRKVSRTHCLVAVVEHRIFVRDLASTNGVWINGHRVDREQRLRVGDELSVAEVRFELSNDDGQKQAAPKQDQTAPGRTREEDRDKGKGRDRAAEREAAVMGLPRRSVKPIYIDPDEDQPVVLPDEDDSFVVEPSLAKVAPIRPDRVKAERKQPPAELVRPKSEEKKRPEPSKPKSKAEPPPSSDEIPVLDDGDLIDLQGLLQEDEDEAELEDSGSDNRRRR